MAAAAQPAAAPAGVVPGNQARDEYDQKVRTFSEYLQYHREDWEKRITMALDSQKKATELKAVRIGLT
jgi:hypothetical protein